MLNRNDLDLMYEVLEIAVQTPGFIDTTSSGGCTPQEEQAYLTEMRQLLDRIRAELRGQTSLERIELLEAYVADMRKTMHVMAHTVYLLSVPDGTTRCIACGERFADKPGEMKT